MAEEEGKGEKIVLINIEDEMKTAYIDYSMSVIVSRALPDVRDGMKPVHRRVLFGMYEMGVMSNRPYKKSARIVGDVMGKYHPHGDASVYDTMVRMAQDWSLRYPLVDGQGNYGSIDGDPPAAMRYTEARLRKIAEDTLADIDKNTVDFRPNFDDSLEEPTVLPTRIPNLLINGASGIAVGMATNMAPHNLTEIIDGTMAYIDNRDITVEGLMEYIKAPDFPTGGTIYGYEGVKAAFETGRGRIVIRAKSQIEQFENGRERIIVNEIPYQVNKAEMIKKTAALINDKKIEGITDIRDESDRDGYRVVYELRRDAITSVVLNNLYKHTELQTSFSVNNIALVEGRPTVLNLKDLIVYFVKHRHEVVVRRTQYELEQAEKRAHVLEGYLIALDHLDEVIKLIRNSNTPEIAKDGLMESFALSEIQAKAVLALRLSTLTGLERDKIKEEYDELMKMIAHYKEILSNETMRYEIIKGELLEVKEKYGDERRSDIIYAGADFRMEDMIADEDVVITISHMGYIKRTAATEYRQQARGGRGSKGTRTRDEDFVEQIFIASTHNYMLFFTEQGKCFWMKVYEIPEGSKDSKGRAIQNLLHIAPDDKIRAFINVTTLEDTDYINGNYIIMCTNKGTIKKTLLEAYSRPRQNGINAITVRDGETLLEARLVPAKDAEGVEIKSDILMALSSGKCIRFPQDKIRPMGRNASGVRGVRLANADDKVVGMICIPDPTHNVLVVSENGYGKRSEVEEYRITNRGGKGVKTINVTDKTGALIALKEVTNEDDLMIITKNGIVIRLAVADMRLMGRATQGVRLIKLGGKDAIAAVTQVESDPEEEHVQIDGEVLEGPVIDEPETDEPDLEDEGTDEGAEPAEGETEE